LQKEIDTKLQNIENENKDIPIAFDDVFIKASLYWDILKRQDIIVLESEAKVYNEYIKLITGYDKKIGFYQDSMFIDLEHFSNFL